MKQCRICLQENYMVEDLIKPCSCDGTQKFVHRSCLEEWRRHSVDTDNYNRCPDCHTNYKFKENLIKYSRFKNFIVEIHNLCHYQWFVTCFTYVILLLFGILTKYQCSFMNNMYCNELNDIAKDATNYSYIIYPLFGNMIFSVINLVLYFFTNLCQCKNMNYKQTHRINGNDFNISNGKILSYAFINFIITLAIPFVGFFTNFPFLSSFFSAI